MEEYRKKMDYVMRLRRLAEETIKSYWDAFEKYLRYYNKPPEMLDKESVEKYLYHLGEERQLAYSTCNQAYRGIQFYYRYVLQRKDIDNIRLKNRRNGRKITQIFSKEEIKQLFHASTRIKEKAILILACGAGLRVSDIVKLKVRDIESNRMMIRVEQGKGKKDRYVILLPEVLQILRDYWRVYKPKGYLFPGKTKGGTLSKEAAQAIYYKAKRRSKLNKGKGIHTLRHCFCTYLLEQGVDVFKVQSMMGHRSLRTTVKYWHVTKPIWEIRSPLDDLFENDENK